MKSPKLVLIRKEGKGMDFMSFERLLRLRKNEIANTILRREKECWKCLPRFGTEYERRGTHAAVAAKLAGRVATRWSELTQ